MVRAEALRLIQAVPNSGAQDRDWTARVVSIYYDLMDSGVHFAQAAYRDGEFSRIVGAPVVTSNGESMEPELGKLLADTLLHPVGQWCLYFESTNPQRPAADAWLAKHSPPVEWIADRPFGRANEQGLLAPFFFAARKRRVCVVGPGHLSQLPANLLGPFRHVTVPDQTAWTKADRLGRRIVKLADDYDLFLIAAGCGANLIVHHAWPHVQDRATLIDIGAVLDPYAGVFSRNTYRTEHWQRNVMPLNLPTPKAYWINRFGRQGEYYVAKGGKESSYRDQIDVLTPVLSALVKGSRVLDFGCGLGRFRGVLSQGREYVGVDLIPGLGTEPFGDRLPTGFSTAVAVMVLQHITDAKDYAHWSAELYRCLEPGGRLVVVDHYPESNMEEHMLPRGIEALRACAPWASADIVGEYEQHWIGVLIKEPQPITKNLAAA